MLQEFYLKKKKKTPPHECNSLFEPEVKRVLRNQRTAIVVHLMGMIRSVGQNRRRGEERGGGGGGQDRPVEGAISVSIVFS